MKEIKELVHNIFYGVGLALIFLGMMLVKADEQVETRSRIGRAVPAVTIPASDYQETNMKPTSLDWRWKYDGTWYDLTQLRRVLPAVKHSDLKRFKCEVLCTNQKGYVVGYNPNVFK